MSDAARLIEDLMPLPRERQIQILTWRLALADLAYSSHGPTDKCACPTHSLLGARLRELREGK